MNSDLVGFRGLTVDLRFSTILYHCFNRGLPCTSSPWQWTSLLLSPASSFMVSTLPPSLTLTSPWPPVVWLLPSSPGLSPTMISLTVSVLATLLSSPQIHSAPSATGPLHMLFSLPGVLSFPFVQLSPSHLSHLNSNAISSRKAFLVSQLSLDVSAADFRADYPCLSQLL